MDGLLGTDRDWITRVKEEKRKLVNQIYQTWHLDCSHTCGQDVMTKGNTSCLPLGELVLQAVLFIDGYDRGGKLAVFCIPLLITA